MQEPLSKPAFKAIFNYNYSQRGTNQREEDDTIFSWEMVLNMIEADLDRLNAFAVLRSLPSSAKQYRVGSKIVGGDVGRQCAYVLEGKAAVKMLTSVHSFASAPRYG
ncbi:hypothetical protein F2P81_020358 [Scophthalmus maximus]|uniref:Uncharacterized protein n=1 Tax=Scophthalmus maximus TaxID=52904 RepID=A0A6A4S3M1_SCOMX|nr:hypothetical protein F2P81_020358 [Scophthalmus maximus]